MVTFKDYLEQNHPDYYNQLVEEGYFSGIGRRIKQGLLGGAAALSLLGGAPNKSHAVEPATKTIVNKKSNLPPKFRYLNPLEKLVQQNGYKLELKGNDIYVEVDFGDIEVAPGAGGPNNNYVPTQGFQPSEIAKELKEVLLEMGKFNRKSVDSAYKSSVGQY